MKKISLTKYAIVALVSLFSAATAQTIDENSNWFKEIGRYDDYFSQFDFRRYTKDDVVKAKTRFLEIEGDKSLSEWEGLYHQEAMLGHEELMWSFKSGFVNTYTYHTLAFLDFGKVDRHESTISLRSEKDSKRIKKDKLCFVRFGDTHFLVPIKSLRYFAEEAAGLSVNRYYDENKYYWVEYSKRDSKVFGLPIFPKQFAHYVRQPIDAKVIFIGKPKTRKHLTPDGSYAYTQNTRFLTINAGKNKGVKVGMSFVLDGYEERIDITRVSKTMSFGKLERYVESNQEVCEKYVDGNQKEFPCRRLQVYIRAHTLSEIFDF